MNYGYGNKTSTSGLVVAIASVLLTIALYYADASNVPVIAPWLDFIADKIYGWLPLLTRLIPQESMVVGAAVVGFGSFLVATIAVAFLIPSARIGAMENQMRMRSRQRQPRRVKIQ